MGDDSKPTLVLAPRFTEDSIALSKAAARLGWAVERLPSWRVPPGLHGREVVLYAEPLFVAAVAEELGVAVLEPSISWLTDLSDHYRRRQVELTTLGSARQITRRAFFKPAVDKVFPTGIYEGGLRTAADHLLPDATPVFVSDVVSWEVEYRCFVAARTVRTISPYWRGDRSAQSEDGDWPAAEDELTAAQEFAESVLSDVAVAMPPAFVLDVGLIAGYGWAVIEANSAWGAGIYGCDPAEVLAVVRRSCVNANQLKPEDAPWLVQRSWEKQ